MSSSKLSKLLRACPEFVEEVAGAAAGAGLAAGRAAGARPGSAA